MATLGQSGAEPGTGRDHMLKDRAFGGPEMRGLQPATTVDLGHNERVAGVEMPDFVRLDAVEAGALAGFQQEIDRRRYAACPGESPGKRGQAFTGAIGLAEPAAFGMRGKLELSDQIGGVHRR